METRSVGHGARYILIFLYIFNLIGLKRDNIHYAIPGGHAGRGDTGGGHVPGGKAAGALYVLSTWGHDRTGSR